MSGCGDKGTCVLGIADLDCENCEGAVQREAIAARARGDYETERARLDTLALFERRRAGVGSGENQ